MDQPPEDLLDPISLLLRSLRAASQATNSSPHRAPETEAAPLLRQWLTAGAGLWGAASPLSDLTELWSRALGAPDVAGDLIGFWVRWYEANADTLAAALDELLRAPAFVRASARALDDFASAAANQRRAAELAARGLPFATHADTTRLARMLVDLETKIERLMEPGQSATEHHGELAEPAEIAALAARLDRIEAKVDRLVASLPGTPPPSRPARRPAAASARPAQRAEAAAPALSARRGRTAKGSSQPPSQRNVRLVRQTRAR